MGRVEDVRKKTPARTKRKPSARPYKVVITMRPAQRCATILLHGKLTTLWNPAIGWETEAPKHMGYRVGDSFFLPDHWLRFYIQGGWDSQPERKRKALAIVPLKNDDPEEDE